MKRKYVRMLTGVLCVSFLSTGCGNSETTSKSEVNVNLTNSISEDNDESILNESKENIEFINGLKKLTCDENYSVTVTEEEKQKIESMMLFGYEGSLNMQGSIIEKHVTNVIWKSKDEASDTEYNDMESSLSYLYGQSGANPEGESGYYWSTSDVDINLKQEDDDGVSRIVIDFQFKSDDEENEDSDTTAESSDLNNTNEDVENLDTLDAILAKQNEIIDEYKQVFEESNVPYMITANGSTILGTELSYNILDTPYNVAEMISSVYDRDDKALKTTINVTIEYHEEKGIDKENPHIVFLYNLFSKFKKFDSIDDMISMLNEGMSGSYGTLSWSREAKYGKGKVMRLNLAYEEEQTCSYEELINYCELNSLDERDQKEQEYKDRIQQKLSEIGADENSYVEAVLYEGDERASYADKIGNDLGIMLHFRRIRGLDENVDMVINIMKAYVEAANEVFGVGSDATPEMIARDIVTRQQLKMYNENSMFRLAQGVESYQDVSLPTKDILDDNKTPLLNIQYVESGYYHDTYGAYTKGDDNLTIEYYIPIKVDGLLNK